MNRPAVVPIAAIFGRFSNPKLNGLSRRACLSRCRLGDSGWEQSGGAKFFESTEVQQWESDFRQKKLSGRMFW